MPMPTDAEVAKLATQEFKSETAYIENLAGRVSSASVAQLVSAFGC